jgi:hypothetical protein
MQTNCSILRCIKPFISIAHEILCLCVCIIQKATLYGSRLWNGSLPKPKLELDIEGCSRKAIVHDGGMLLLDENGQAVSMLYSDGSCHLN